MPYKNVKSQKDADEIRAFTMIHEGFDNLYYQYFPEDIPDKRPSFWESVACFWKHRHNWLSVKKNYGLNGYHRCTLCEKRKGFWFRDTPFSHAD